MHIYTFVIDTFIHIFIYYILCRFIYVCLPMYLQTLYSDSSFFEFVFSILEHLFLFISCGKISKPFDRRMCNRIDCSHHLKSCFRDTLLVDATKMSDYLDDRKCQWLHCCTLNFSWLHNWYIYPKELLGQRYP